ncbi:MAG TPA: amidohydrolase [Polyangiaceae bacterium]|nr:amidohydrolase [Polyangiaceae bacterium]
MVLDRKALDLCVDELTGELSALSRRIHAHPELCFEERQAATWLADCLEHALGAKVERGLGGLETAFRARVGSGSPRIAILAEYDALPEIGHACGHNLIAGGAVGAFLALARHCSAWQGSVEIIGTPAEEGGGGKIKLLQAGVFEGVDAAMMFHPFDRDILAHPALCSMRIAMTYQGVPAHAAAAPFAGKSALTACMETFRLIDSQRVHFRDGTRVHGIITNGGQAVNVIVEHAASEFTLRAQNSAELERVKAIVLRCARGAALAGDVLVSFKEKVGYREMKNNLTMARRFGAALEALGRNARETDARVGAGSTDMGDLSLHLPSIHPYLAICDEGESLCHEHRFADCAASERGMSTMLVAAKAMARTTCDLLEDPKLFADVRREFAAAH